MGMFDKAKDLYKLQKQAKDLKKQLKNIHIESEGDISITVDGEQKFIKASINKVVFDGFNIDESIIEKLSDKLANAFVEAGNKAIKKSQEVGAQKMQEVMGGLGGVFGQ